MDVLKKIKASTLMETLVATVLLVIVFMVASLILNNTFSNSIKKDTSTIESTLNEYEYLYFNNKIEVPFSLDQDNINISIERIKAGENNIIEFEGINKQSNKSILRQYIETN